MYISDGGKQYYKNKYQMCNHHEEGFSAKVNWHFFANVYGKGACGGVEVNLKREATRASLQVQPKDATLTSQLLQEWTNRKFKDLHVIYYYVQEHRQIKRFLKKRFSEAPQ